MLESFKSFLTLVNSDVNVNEMFMTLLTGRYKVTFLNCWVDSFEKAEIWRKRRGFFWMFRAEFGFSRVDMLQCRKLWLAQCFKVGIIGFPMHPQSLYPSHLWGLHFLVFIGFEKTWHRAELERNIINESFVDGVLGSCKFYGTHSGTILEPFEEYFIDFEHT